MLFKRFTITAFSACATFLFGVGAYAAAYPDKPIRIVSPGTGGSGDFTARLLAQGLTEKLGQQVVVENRNGVVAIETVSKALPDGYTLLFFGSGIWTLPLLRKTSYDPTRDFLPIVGVVSAPSVITVHPSLPANSVKELIALAQAKPGQLNYSSGQAGTVGHLAGELFKTMARVNIVNVPYAGTGASVIAVLSGEVKLTFAAVDTVAPHIKSGKLRALAVMSATPTALAPGLPTVSSSGLPGYVVASNNALWAPAGTAPAIIKRLHQEAVAFLKRPDIVEKFLTAGLDVVASPPQQVTATMKSEMARWGKLIKDLGIREE